VICGSKEASILDPIKQSIYQQQQQQQYRIVQ